MKISVAVIGDQARSPIPERLDQATHLFIIDADQLAVLRIFTTEETTDRDIAFARQTLSEDCEAIICGEMEERAFELLAAACVSRYNGTGYHASQATRLINARQLPLIREYIGGPGLRRGARSRWRMP